MNLIISADINWGIGKNNRLLFRIIPDMRNFKEKTVGGAVIMGRKTLESLPGSRPLNDRINIVMTRNPGRLEERYQKRNSPVGAALRFCRSLDELAFCIKGLDLGPDKVWVIGGAEIILLLSPFCEEAYVTRILAVGDADCRINEPDRAEGWSLAEMGEIEEWEGLRYRFDRYKNNAAKPLPEPLVSQ